MNHKKAVLLGIVTIALILTLVGTTSVLASSGHGHDFAVTSASCTPTVLTINSPRDAASGLALCDPHGNGIKSPRDAASGQATG